MWDSIFTPGLSFQHALPLGTINALPANRCIARLLLLLLPLLCWCCWLLLLLAVVELEVVVVVGCGTSRGARAGIRSASAGNPGFQLEVTPCFMVCPLCFAFGMHLF